MLLNKDTKKAKQFKSRYYHAIEQYALGDRRYGSVMDFYKNPSSDKIYAENRILDYMEQYEGHMYRVTGGNCMCFSCGFTYRDHIKHKDYLLYFTRYNEYLIEL